MCSPVLLASTSVRDLSAPLVEGAALRHFYSMSGYIHKGGEVHDTFYLPALSKKIYLRWVHDAHFQFTKVTTADQHIIKAYQPKRPLHIQMDKPPEISGTLWA